MSWNHRIIKSQIGDDVLYGIHEVYYNEDGSVKACTHDPIYLLEESPEELQGTLARISKAFDLEILDMGIFDEMGEPEPPKEEE